MRHNDLKEALQSAGWRIAENPFRDAINEADWYAWLPGRKSDRKCLCNDKPPAVTVNPSQFDMRGHVTALAAGQAAAAQQSGAKLNYSVLYVYANQHGIDYNSLCVAVREASAQPVAQQGVAYAALPDEREAFESWLRSVWTAGYGCPKCDSGKYVHGEAQRFWECWQARASHGQAPAGAGEAAEHYRNAIARARLLDSDLSNLTERGAKAWAGVDAQGLRDGGASLSANAGQADEYPALVCDYCGALTPDPWHSSGMLHGKMSKHIHSCDACAARGAAEAQAADSVTAPAPPPECETEAEKRAFAFGWFKALESERMKAESVQEDAARYRWLAEHCRSTSEHWGGRWSIIIDGPAPKSHDSEDDFDAAVDAARKQGDKP